MSFSLSFTCAHSASTHMYTYIIYSLHICVMCMPMWYCMVHVCMCTYIYNCMVLRVRLLYSAKSHNIQNKRTMCCRCRCRCCWLCSSIYIWFVRSERNVKQNEIPKNDDVATSFPRDSPCTSNVDGLTNTLYHHTPANRSGTPVKIVWESTRSYVFMCVCICDCACSQRATQ